MRTLTLVSLLIVAIAVGCSSGDVDPIECDRIRLSGPITLTDAAQYDCAVTARTLVEPQGSIPGADINPGTLVIAARHNSVNVARILIDGGADINAKDRIGATPLHWAARANSLDIARLLIDKGADIEAKNNRDGTPLHWATRVNSLDIARLLIEHGANTDGIDLSWMN